MKPNLYPADRFIRLLFVAAVAILYMTNVIDGTLAMVLGIVAAVFALTAMLNYCPLYTILGINSRKNKTAL